MDLPLESVCKKKNYQEVDIEKEKRNFQSKNYYVISIYFQKTIKRKVRTYELRSSNSTLFALTVIFIVLLSSSSLSSSELRVEQIGDRFNAGEGYMEMYGPLVFMHLKGTPYEMGLQHGTLLAYLYSEDYLLKMKDELDPFKAQASGFEQLVQTFQKFYFHYKMATWILRNIPEDLFQELEGIVAGVSGGKNTDPMEVIIANVSQDLGMTFGCTSIVAFGEATANGSLYHARNLDNLSMVDWAQYGYVVVYEPDYGIHL